MTKLDVTNTVNKSYKSSPSFFYYMGNKKLILVTIILLVLFSYTYAFTYESYTYTVDLNEDKPLHTIQAVIDITEQTDNFEISLVPRIENLNVVIDDEVTKCNLIEEIGYSVLNCLPLEDEGKHFITINFNSNYPVFNVEDKVLYKTSFDTFNQINYFTFLLKLSEGSVIPQEEGRDSSFFITPKDPKEDSIYSDGRRIILLWEEETISQDYEISVLIEGLNQPLSNVFIPVIITLLVLVTLIYRYRNKNSKEAVEAVLIEKEEKIVEVLKHAEKHTMWQKQLQRETGFSKAKLSRTLNDLEKRGIIKKEPVGNTNKIHLKI